MRGWAGFASAYGLVLVSKIALFALILMLAAANRFIFVRRLRQLSDGQAVRALLACVLLELLLGASVVTLAAALSFLPPPLEDGSGKGPLCPAESAFIMLALAIGGLTCWTSSMRNRLWKPTRPKIAPPSS